MGDSSKHFGKPGGKHRVETRDREVVALQLRRSGASYQVIAERLGYRNRSSAWKAVARVLKATLVEEATSLRELEADRLDRLQLGLWPKAVAGDVKATTGVLRIMERRARLLGLDEPTRVSNLVTLRRIAERAAQEMDLIDLDVDEVVAEASRILNDAANE